MKTCGKCEFRLGEDRGGSNACAKGFYDVRKKYQRRGPTNYVTVNPADRACEEFAPKEPTP